MSYKDGVRKAMEAYLEKQNAPAKPRRSNEKPEAEFMLLLKKHLDSLGWSVDIVESKGVYNEEAGRYMHGKTRPGYPDISGNLPNGIACYVEVKAPGRRSTVRPDQHQFLIEKIDTNCFAIVCDSIEYLERVYGEWIKSDAKKALLLKELPQLAKHWTDQDNEPLF